MWTRLDDGFTEHPKMAQVGPLGMALQVAGLVYCNRNLTDGFIPFGVARSLLHLKHEDTTGRVFHVAMACGMQGWDPDEALELVITWMVEANVWEQVPGGYLIHDFDDYNLTKEQVLARREVRSESGRKGGLAKAKANAKRDAKQTPKQMSTKGSSKEEADLYPVPVPVPDPSPVPEPSPTTSNSLVAPTERRSRRNGNKAPKISETEAFNLDALRNRNPVWDRLGESGVTKLNGVYGLQVVSEALTRARSTDLDPMSAYPYLDAICKELSSGEATA